MARTLVVVVLLVAVTSSSVVFAAPEPDVALEAALERAGKNAPELEKALREVPAEQRRGMAFLIRHMPPHDLQSLSAAYLLENVTLAYEAWNEAPWKAQVPEAVFLNEILPYASVNERRDRWRKDFFDRFRPLVAEARTPGAAGVLLNQKIFPLLQVKYSRERLKPDQSPYESIETGTASCTGLSILLVNACRAVGVPARFVGTPLWSDGSGNHSWVEIWDGRWHFTGAAEPSGDKLDKAWFTGRASTATLDDPKHAIFATSWKRTPQAFPLSWNPDLDYVSGLNVTARYLQQPEALPEGFVHVRFQVLDVAGGKRQAVKLQLASKKDETKHEGLTRDERFDGNDHLTLPLRLGATYVVRGTRGETSIEETVSVSKDQQLVTILLAKAAR
jgi:hypothetical protein